MKALRWTAIALAASSACVAVKTVSAIPNVEYPSSSARRAAATSRAGSVGRPAPVPKRISFRFPTTQCSPCARLGGHGAIAMLGDRT